jgi:homoserine kinase
MTTVHIRVPATSANLGPGYDSLGLALSLYDDIDASLADSGGVQVVVTGEGTGEGHLVVRAMRRAFDRMGTPQPGGIRLRCHNRIPHARGLGSSSAAICAGILAARALSRNGDLTDDEVFALADEMEGHPDNVAPCLAGGLTIAWTQHSGAPRMVKLVPDASIRPVAIVPATRLATETARDLLPKDVPHKDASFNAGRAALLIAALTQRPERALLLAATEDRLHQDYRAPAMRESADLVERLRI